MNDHNMINSAAHQADDFDDFLRQQLHAPYIADEGFTACVMACLPAPKAINPWLERIIVALPVALISVLVFSQFPWRDLVQQVYAWFLVMDTTNLAGLALGLFSLLVLAPVAWFAMGDE